MLVYVVATTCIAFSIAWTKRVWLQRLTACTIAILAGKQCSTELFLFAWKSCCGIWLYLVGRERGWMGSTTKIAKSEKREDKMTWLEGEGKEKIRRHIRWNDKTTWNQIRWDEIEQLRWDDMTMAEMRWDAVRSDDLKQESTHEKNAEIQHSKNSTGMISPKLVAVKHSFCSALWAISWNKPFNFETSAPGSPYIHHYWRESTTLNPTKN